VASASFATPPAPAAAAPVDAAEVVPDAVVLLPQAASPTSPTAISGSPIHRIKDPFDADISNSVPAADPCRDERHVLDGR